MRRFANALILGGLVLPHAAFACGIEGSITHTDGSKANGDRVTTSYTSAGAAHASNGSYSLDLGSVACGNRVDVYVNSYGSGRC